MDVALDSAGKAYLTGYTDSADFPTSAGALQPSYGGNFDAFVTRLTAAGTALDLSTYLGGSDVEQGYGIAVDLAGDIYVVGQTRSLDFPTTTGAFDMSLSGPTNGFASKLSPGPSVIGPPTDKSQCKDGGWRLFNNPAFKNQGQCVSSVVRKNR